MQKFPSKKLIALLSSILIIFLIYNTLLFTCVIKSNDYTPVQSDAILVLGYSLEDNQPSPYLEKRLETALSLYNEGYAKNIIVSGGIGPTDTIPVAVSMKKWFMDKGVPSQFIITENYANNTYENFVYSKEICEDKDFDSVIVVTNDFHMYRSMLTANEFFDNVSGSSADVSPSPKKFLMYLKEPLSIIKYELINKNSSQNVLSSKNELIDMDKKYNQLYKSDYIPKYDISIEYKSEENKFYGTETVTFKNTSNKTINNIKMNLYHNRLKAITNQDKDFINILSVSSNNKNLDFTDNFSYIDIQTPDITPNNIFSFTINFDLVIPKTPYMTGSNDPSIWAMDFIPTLSSFENGEFTENDYFVQSGYNTISNYEVSFITDSNLTVILPGKTTASNNGIKKTTIMESTLLRSPSFAILNNPKKTSTLSDDNITISFYHNQENSIIYHLSNLIQTGMNIMCKNIGIYPYDELNIVEIETNEPFVYSSSNMIFVDKDYMTNPNVKLELLNAVVHQWFGCIVYSYNPNDFITTGLSRLLSSQIFNLNTTNNEFFTQEYNFLLKHYDILEETNLLSENYSFSSYPNYYYIKHVKSMLMFADLKNNMGDNWQSFLSLLYNIYSFDIITIDDLKIIATEFTDIDIDSFFDNWINNDPIISQGGIE